MPNKFHRIKKIAKGKQFTKIKEGWIFKDGVFQKVWSGASEVSYYDGDTLLGIEEVDEGEDVLHPSISTTKSGYTLYGWATAKDSETRVTSLLATGEPMTVYAIYLPNTKRVAGCSLTTGLWTNYSNVYIDSEHVSGGIVASAQRAAYYTGGGLAEASASFLLNLGKYQGGTITYRNITGNGNNFSQSFDGISISNNVTGSKVVTAQVSSHSMHSEGYAESNSWTSSITAVTDITLTNPIAWT